MLGVTIHTVFFLINQPAMCVGYRVFRMAGKLIRTVAANAFGCGGAVKGSVAAGAVADVGMVAAKMSWRPKRLGVSKPTPGYP